MFCGGHAKHEHYFMEKVPLRIGVKIRPDDNFYNQESVDSYKEASVKLNNIQMANDLKVQEEKNQKLHKLLDSSDTHKTKSQAKSGIDILARSMSFAVHM